ncbi:hypothetical protein, partial [Salmonella sp. s54836]|uniref:hypothetical protein n=1 Tax=Salmonella sp. s54836 TaxID=3159673 RepID=UPI0039811159
SPTKPSTGTTIPLYSSTCAAKPQVKSKTNTQVLSIPIDNCSSFNFGTREQNLSDACKRVKEQTGCAIEVHSNDTAVSFMITGSSNKIDSTKQLLICELKHKETIEYTVPKEYHRHILGKKRAKLFEIQ